MSKNKTLPNHVRMMLADTTDRVTAIDDYLRQELDSDYVFEQATPIQNSFGESYILVVTRYDPVAAKAHPAMSRGRAASKTTKATASSSSSTPKSGGTPAKSELSAAKS